MWRVAANILNKKSRTEDKGSTLGVGKMLTNPHRKITSRHEIFKQKA